MTQCIFLLAFTALKNDCSFLWLLEPEPEEVTFKESLFTPSSGRGPLRELCEAAPRLGADLRACIQTHQFGRNSRERTLAQEREVRVTSQLGAPCLPLSWNVLQSGSVVTCHFILHTFWKLCPKANINLSCFLDETRCN